MKIGFLGDSITLGYALDNPSDRYSTLLCTTLHAKEVNHGICGTLVARAGLSRDNGTAYIDRVQNLAGCDYAIVYGGTNDYFWSDTPIFGNTPAHFEQALHLLGDSLLAMFPAERILFLTPTNHHGTGNFAGGNRFNHSSEHDTTAVNYVGHIMEDYADAILAFCRSVSIPCLDLYRSDFDWRIHTSDGCHPNPDGHRWLAERILESGFLKGD